jgi:tetratricopeptide (TPR) repeat protein
VGYGDVIAHRRHIALAVLLALATLVLYAPVVGFEFVDYDDRTYVTENPQVQRGFSVQAFGWAFTTVVGSNWHPVTMLSHAFSWSLFGAWAGGHHAVNVVLHVGNVLLLYALLLRTTGAWGRAAVVAALFAVHPLRVESVAWVAERKDVLSALFFLGALNAYVGWVRRPSVARYAVVALLFVLGLLTKATVLTLPPVLLLLDRWPLARSASWTRLITEKAPLFALTAASVLTTLFAVGGAVNPLAHLSIASRLENACVSLVAYLVSAVWPARLSVLYLHPGAPGGVPVAWPALVGSLAVVTCVSIWVLRERRWAYLTTGWGWYMLTLAPVLGLVQAGIQARADRYTYLPLIGPCILLVWWAGDRIDARAFTAPVRRGIAALTIAVVLAYAGVTRSQLRVWHDSESLYSHAIAVDPRNFMMHFNLGTVLAAEGRSDEALDAFRRAMAIHPRYPLAHRALAVELERRGRLEEALPHFREAVRLDPSNAASVRVLGDAVAAHGEIAAAIDVYRRALALDAEDAHAHNNLGNVLAATGDVAGARAAYARAVALDPSLVGAHGNLAASLEETGDWQAALEHRRAHARLEPRSAEAQRSLATALLHAGDAEHALAPLRAAVRLDPERTDTRQLLAWVLATRPSATVADGAEAVRLAEAVVQAQATDPVAWLTLAVAQAAAGQFPAALASLDDARRLALAARKSELIPVLDEMQDRFRRGEPYREPS